RALNSGTLSRVLSVTSEPTVAEAYNAEGEILDVGLAFRSDITPVAEFELLENRPNPFNESTTIIFRTPHASTASVSIFDVTGKLVYSTTVDAQVGLNEVVVSGLEARGVLYCTVSTEGFSATRKMIRME